jgi:predicted nucleic acid-binding protein
MIVVDASVAVKWLLPEPGDAAARELLEGGRVLVSPALIRVEVAGAVLRHFREGRLSESAARTVCESWGQMLDQGIIGILSVDKVFARAVELSIACRHALADCVYLAAAEEFDAEVVTADRLMYERGQRAYRRITLLRLAA